VLYEDKVLPGLNPRREPISLGFGPPLAARRPAMEAELDELDFG
jgi:hypothetical protein